MNNPRKIISHGTGVALQLSDNTEMAVLLRGKAGAGKSDLAFRLIENMGGKLVADDQVTLENVQGNIHVRCENPIKGILEVRGVGLLRYPISTAVKLGLVIDLVAKDKVPRLPEHDKEEILGIPIPHLKLCPFESSAPLKVYKALEIVNNPKILAS